MHSDPPALGTSVLDDRELLQKARAAENGRQFELLYDQGWSSPIVQRKYEKPRHARLALINHLVWWARQDLDQIRRLFSRSALCPGDLTRYKDYFRSLVRAAVNLLDDECYNPHFAAATTT